MCRVAVIGAGQWGRNLVRTFHQLGALVAVAEASPALREKLAEEYPGFAIYDDYRPLLQQSEIQAVVIATPVATHFAVAREALLAGKDVFVEKPITMSSVEAEALCKLAEEKGRILMVGHLLLFQPAIQLIKKYLDEGQLGDVYSLQQIRAKLGRVRTVENVLWSFGVHDIAVLLHLVGRTPERVNMSGQRMLQAHLEDDVYLHLDFPGNVQAHLHTSWLWPQQERRLTVVGSQGMLVYDELEQTVTLHRKGVHADLSNRDEGAEVLFRGAEQPLLLECSHFLECVAHRQRPLADGQNGVDVVRVIEAAMGRMREGVQG